MNANVKKTVSGIHVLIALALLVIMALLCYRVYNSLTVEGLTDPEAPAAVKSLTDIYDVAQPVTFLAGLFVIGSFFLNTSIGKLYKTSLVVLVVLLGVGLYVDLQYFYDATDSAFAVQDKGTEQLTAIYATIPAPETIVFEGADPSLMAAVQGSEQMVQAQQGLLIDYTQTLEIPVNGIMAQSAILTLAYFGCLIWMSVKVVFDLRSQS